METPASSTPSSSASSAPQPPSANWAETLPTLIAQREAELRHAMLTSDTEQLDTLLADELLFMDLQGQLLTKAVDLETHRSGQLRLSKLLPLEQATQLLNATTVVATVLMEVAGTYATQPFEARCRYLRVWAINHGRWQVTAGAVSHVV